MVYVCKGETLFFPVCFVCCSCRRGWDYGRCCVTLLLPVHLRQKKRGKEKEKQGQERMHISLRKGRFDFLWPMGLSHTEEKTLC